jgi:hypothetical protein
LFNHNVLYGVRGLLKALRKMIQHIL